jgi:hypothetical protein
LLEIVPESVIASPKIPTFRETEIVTVRAFDALVPATALDPTASTASALSASNSFRIVVPPYCFQLMDRLPNGNKVVTRSTASLQRTYTAFGFR